MSISITDKLFLTKHLSTLIRSGVPLDDSLETVKEQATPELRRVLVRLLEEIRSGQLLSDAMKKFPKVFDKFFVSLVGAGEKSGNLEKNLIFLAEQMGKDAAMRRKVKGALMYPTLVLSVTTVMGIGISWFVLPKLIDMFASFEVELPFSTRVLMGFAFFVRDYGAWAIFGLILLIALAVITLRLRFMRKAWDKVALKLPIVGKIVLFGELSRFSRNLGLMLKSGLPVIDALEVTTETLTNLKFVDDLKLVITKVEEGKSMVESLDNKRFGEFDKLCVRMIGVGEKSGNLEEMLLYLSEYYDEEIEGLSKNLSTLLEPVMLIGIGLVVGFVAYAIVTPIYSLMGGIK